MRHIRRKGKIGTFLRESGCSGRNFIDISKALGAQISTGGFSEVMSGKRQFDREVADRLLEVLGRMKELQTEVGDVPVAWHKTNAVATALAFRLVDKTAKDLNIENADIHEAALQATQEVAK